MKLLKLLAVIVLLPVAFAGGYVLRATRHANAQAGGRRILYYVDPMHPAYKSDKPGIAPDCGMKLEPVYADEGAAPAPAAQKGPSPRAPQEEDQKAQQPGAKPETRQPAGAGLRDARRILPA